MSNNKPSTILIIDDEQSIRESICEFLEDYGYKMLSAENGRIGLEIFAREKPDLVLVDLRMPEIDGLEVLARVTTNSSDTPIIVLSGAGAVNDVVEALRLGAWNYLLKPVADLSVLLHALEKALERARLIRENHGYQAHLEEEVAKRTEELKRTAAEERALGILLRLSLKQIEMESFLQQALLTLLDSVPWLRFLSRGNVLLCKKNEKGKFLQLVAGHEQVSELGTVCTQAPFGKCLCGRAVLRRNIEFAAPADCRHETGSAEISANGYYAIPILTDDDVLGVIMLYLPDGHQETEYEKAFLRRVADVLSMGILRRYAEAKIEFLAYRDALTGLPNRRLLLDRLQQDMTLAARRCRYGGLLFIDLDHFKNLNDSLGHAFGDTLLQQVAERLNGQIRGEDTVARLGGDEFVVLLPELNDSRKNAGYLARNLAEKLRAVLSQAYTLQTHKYHLTPSIGIAIFPVAGESGDDVLKHADAAMYRAKAEGRNTVRFYRPDMQIAADTRLSLEKDLRQAVEQEEFTLYYQPQVAIKTGKIIGAEALLRWRHPERGLIRPKEFIAIAEETGLILSIGEWVLVNTVRQIKAWIDNGHFCAGTAANVSPFQFRQPDFVQQVIYILKEADIPAHCLKLEITEGMAISDVEDTIKKMQELRRFGVRFSMDDFGTGYSSLSYLRRLPLDQLKIDKSFVADITTDPDDAAIVETIIVMARHLGLEVIAEGVETEAELGFLREKNCEAYQGFYFSHPLPAEAFAKLAGKHTY
ncbi:MAG: EAL domain-containing protein [Gammaproteobacteria bacterium]|nr:EAL domain-containing protein [Gammaproteobacteria bacterium]